MLNISIVPEEKILKEMFQLKKKKKTNPRTATERQSYRAEIHFYAKKSPIETTLENSVEGLIYGPSVWKSQTCTIYKTIIFKAYPKKKDRHMIDTPTHYLQKRSY